MWAPRTVSGALRGLRCGPCQTWYLISKFNFPRGRVGPCSCSALANKNRGPRLLPPAERQDQAAVRQGGAPAGPGSSRPGDPGAHGPPVCSHSWSPSTQNGHPQRVGSVTFRFFALLFLPDAQWSHGRASSWPRKTTGYNGSKGNVGKGRAGDGSRQGTASEEALRPETDLL